MFTAKIKSKDFFNGEVRVEVEFLQDSPDAQPFVETFRPRSAEELDRLIKNKVEELERVESFIESVEIGVYDLTPVPQQQPEIPTEAVPEVEPELFIMPTAEELSGMSYSERQLKWMRARTILGEMLNLKKTADEVGRQQSPERLAYIEMLADYVDNNIEAGFIMSN